MFIMLDILLMLVMMIVVFMVYSGFMSLLDRKVMAMTQNSVGPALFLFGLCTPMFDGVKLMLKFGLLILNVEILYLFLMIMYSLMFTYGVLFMVPTSNINIMNLSFNHFMMLSIHTMLSVVDTFLVGCFIINTCFVYLATMSAILFSIMAEFCMLMVFMFLMNTNFYALLNFMMINVFNVILMNALCFPMFLMLLIIMCMFLQNLINLFEFAEAESELVAGTITELSGVFFCMSSLVEITHIMVSTYLIVTMLWGGFFFSIKFMVTLMSLFLVPKLLLCSLKMNNALLFLFFYMFNYLFMFLMMMNIMKISNMSVL